MTLEHSFSAQVHVAAGLRPAEIDDIAGELAEHLEYSPHEGIDSPIAKLGGDIVLSRGASPTFIGGLLVPAARHLFQIIVPATYDSAMHRFTVARQLGHYVLHHTDAQFAEEAQIGMSAEEEANLFAMCFLIPAGELRSRSPRMKSASILADYFDVPLSIMRSRMEMAGLGHAVAA